MHPTADLPREGTPSKWQSFVVTDQLHNEYSSTSNVHTPESIQGRDLKPVRNERDFTNDMAIMRTFFSLIHIGFHMKCATSLLYPSDSTGGDWSGCRLKLVRF